MAIRTCVKVVMRSPGIKGRIIVISLLCGFLLVAGCRQKTADTKVQIEQAVQEMTRATVPAPAAADPAAPPPSTPLQQMNDALALYKAGDFQTAVTRFQTIRADAVMTGGQLLALNHALGAVMSDIYIRAGKGDAAAAQAVKQYEQMQRQRP